MPNLVYFSTGGGGTNTSWYGLSQGVVVSQGVGVGAGDWTNSVPGSVNQFGLLIGAAGWRATLPGSLDSQGIATVNWGYTSGGLSVQYLNGAGAPLGFLGGTNLEGPFPDMVFGQTNSSNATIFHIQAVVPNPPKSVLVEFSMGLGFGFMLAATVTVFRLFAWTARGGRR